MLVSLLGFNRGYEQALNHDIDNMGYQLMVMAKGCPYEAATMMLQGGTGLRYIEQTMVDSIVNNPAVAKVTPILMQAYFDPNEVLEIAREIRNYLCPDTRMIANVGDEYVAAGFQGVYHAVRLREWIVTPPSARPAGLKASELFRKRVWRSGPVSNPLVPSTLTRNSRI